MVAGKYSSAVPTVTENTDEPQPQPLSTIANTWEIHYARFFRFPHLSSSTSSSTSSNLRPLPKSKYRCGGTWFPSSSTLTLQLISDVFNPETILSVSLQGNIVEEHLVCNLHFSWPQVSCVTQCPTRGSRAVLASYRDGDGQIQKFALRFATCFDAENFVDSIKESLKYAMDIRVPRSDFASEISTQSEFVFSNRIRCRGEELSFADPVAPCSPQVTSVMNHSCKQNGYSQESLLGHDFGRYYEADLPPSFTALLTNCSADGEQEQVHGLEEEADLKSQIMRYMSDSSFQDMLAKVEEVITEMGGDLAL